MLNPRRTSYAGATLALLCAGAAAASCGRMVLGRIPAELPDAGPEVGVDTARPGDTSSVKPDLPQVCTSDGWCWTHPLPTSDRFVRAFQVADDDLWFIGASGTIVRFGTGGTWSALPSPVNALSAIWASGSKDVWVGGPAGPYHWDGQSWAIVPPPTAPNARAVNAIWGCSPDDVWVMGTVATHWDGTRLSYVDMPIQAGGFRAVWGTACDDVWAGFLDDALGSGKVVHWNGTNWTAEASRPAEEILGTGADDVWSLAQGQLHHWSGLGAATLRDSRTLNLFPVGANAVGTMNDSHLVSIFARGGAPSPQPATAPDGVTALWGRADDDLWGLGTRGLATHWQGTAWTPQLPGWVLSGDDAIKVTGSSPSDLWAVAGGTLLHGDGVTWQTALMARDVGGRIYDVWAHAPDDVWVLGGDALIHRWGGAGAGWQTVDPPPRGATTPEMRAISGTGPDDVWVLRGRNSILHWDGHNWISRQPLIDNLVGVWASAPNEAWVVGDSVSRWNGTGWSPPRIPPAIGATPFTAVGGSGPTDVWLLAGGYALQVAPDSWNISVVISSDWHAASLAAVAGGGVWVLFQDGTTASRLYRLTAAAPSGTGMPLIAPAGLNDLWSAPDGTLWAAGEGGALIRKRPAP